MQLKYLKYVANKKYWNRYTHVGIAKNIGEYYAFFHAAGICKKNIKILKSKDLKRKIKKMFSYEIVAVDKLISWINFV